MKPILPRPLLWTEIKTMDEFLNEDLLNVALYEGFRRLQRKYLSPNLEAVKVFNEVYYQLVRYYYEGQVYLDTPNRLADIKANLGWSYGADLVIIMMYTYIRLKARPTKNIIASEIIKQLKEKYSVSPFWKEFGIIKSTVWEWPKTSIDPYKPHPISPKKLEGFFWDWRNITNDYDIDAVKDVLTLWDNKEDKSIIARMIDRSMVIGTVVPTRMRKHQEVTNYLRGFIEDYYKRAFDFRTYVKPSNEEQRLQEKIDQIEKEKMVLQGRLEELEAENLRLSALLDNKKKRGEARKFTLVEIVNYCKSRVEWEDAKDIVAMLNRLLFKIGTQEDSDLVDSIEEEFRQRKYGNTFENAQVTMQQPTINGPINEIHNNDKVSLGG